MPDEIPTNKYDYDWVDWEALRIRHAEIEDNYLFNLIGIKSVIENVIENFYSKGDKKPNARVLGTKLFKTVSSDNNPFPFKLPELYKYPKIEGANANHLIYKPRETNYSRVVYKNAKVYIQTDESFPDWKTTLE